MKKYADIGEIIRKKEKHRRTLSKLSFEEKIEMVFKLRERKKFIRSGQLVNTAQKTVKEKPAAKQR